MPQNSLEDFHRLKYLAVSQVMVPKSLFSALPRPDSGSAFPHCPSTSSQTILGVKFFFFLTAGFFFAVW